MVLGNGVHEMRWDDMRWDAPFNGTCLPACLPACLWKGDATILSDRSSDRQRRWWCPPLRWKGREGRMRQAGRQDDIVGKDLSQELTQPWWWHNTGENSDTTSDLPCPVILLRQPNLGTNGAMTVCMYVSDDCMYVCNCIYVVTNNTSYGDYFWGIYRITQPPYIIVFVGWQRQHCTVQCNPEDER